MNIAMTKLLASNASIGKDIKALDDIHLQNKNIAIYQRDIGLFKPELLLLATETFKYQASGTIDEIILSLQRSLDDKLPKYTFLLDDMSILLDLFQKVSKATSFRVLLATISSNMCRRFHTDVNNLRMLCTYIGPGTLWLPDEIVNRKAYHTRGKNQDIVLDETLIQQVETGHVVILKGALYPEAKAIVHRSPTIEETGEKRLLLRIDINETLNF